MIYLILFFGVYFIFKGILLINGRTVPRGVRERIQDDYTLRGWCYGTGVVHVLWGLCAVMLWAANGIASLIMMVRTTRQYSNKR